MDTKTLSKIVASRENPSEKMLQLGQLRLQGFAARGKAATLGLGAIHAELCKFTDAVEKAQADLLAQHPELINLAL